MLFLLFSPAFCHAQSDCLPIDFQFVPPTPSIVPSTWYAGQSYKVVVEGNFTGYPLSTEPGCEYFDSWVDTSASFSVLGPGYPDGTADPYVTVHYVSDPNSNISPTLILGPDQLQVSVTVAANAPTGMDYVLVRCADCDSTAYAPVQIINSCAQPTISSVTPSGWWAGEGSQEITIKGACFSPPSNSGGQSTVTLTDGAGAVTLSNVNVVDSTQITATVKVTKKAPAETVTLTVTTPSSSGQPQSVTANPAPVVLPIPVIKWKDKKISGDNAKEQSVIVGQPVELTTTPATLPGGFTISKSTWDIDGTTIKSYDGDDSGITLKDTDLDTPNTTFYWLYPDDQLNVTYNYCATDPSGNQLCTSPQAKATFKAKGPNASLSTEDSKEATIEHLQDCDNKGKLKGDSPYLGYGDLAGPGPSCLDIWQQLGIIPLPQSGPVGIKLPASGASGGKYFFVQIVDADFSTYTYPLPAGGGSPPTPNVCGPHDGLDKKYPFPGVNDFNSPKYAYDGPEMPLPYTFATGTRNFFATMYLLWQPGQLSGTGAESIPVPMGYQDWQFIATASQKTPMGSDRWKTNRTPTVSGDQGEGFVASTPYDNAIYGYPQWSHVSSNDCGVSQSVDANILNKFSLSHSISSLDNEFNKGKK
jgi:hypothetical protein